MKTFKGYWREDHAVRCAGQRREMVGETREGQRARDNDNGTHPGISGHIKNK